MGVASKVKLGSEPVVGVASFLGEGERTGEERPILSNKGFLTMVFTSAATAAARSSCWCVLTVESSMASTQSSMIARLSARK